MMNEEMKKYYQIESKIGSEKERIVAKKNNFNEAFLLMKDLVKSNPTTNYRLLIITEITNYGVWTNQMFPTKKH